MLIEPLELAAGVNDRPLIVVPPQEYKGACAQGDIERAVGQIKAALVLKDSAAAAATAVAVAAAAAAAAAAEERWTADEVARCSKAMLKYPSGIPDRWQKVAEAIGTKTADDVSLYGGTFDALVCNVAPAGHRAR